MAQSSAKGARRGRDGRFVKRERAAAPSRPPRGRGVGPLALLTPAILLGLIGFLVPACWVGSLVLMGVLWGSVAMKRQQLSGGRGVLSEVVDVVVEEARDVADSASRFEHPDKRTSQ